MAKKVTTPKEKKPKKGQNEEIPKDAWDNFDKLMDKALGTEKKNKKKQAG